MKTTYKFGEVNRLEKQIEFSNERTAFKNIFETENGGVSVLAMKAGQRLEEHIAPFEVMVNVLEGEIEFTMIDMPNRIKAGEFMLMGANVPHSVLANADSKIMLIKVKN